MWSDCVKRRAFKLLLVLLAGAIINVAVAWGCALYSPWWFAKSWAMSSAWNDSWFAWWRANYPFPHVVELPRAPFSMSVIRATGIEIAHISNGAATSQMPPYVTAWRVQCGMPFASLTGSRWSYSHENLPEFKDCEGRFIEFAGRRTWRAEIDWILNGGRIVPFKPLWPGFAINTIFYAAIVFALFAVPGAIKRWRRIKRGLCVRCAYPLGTSGVCSECGTPADNRPTKPIADSPSC
jgi:hypothetical protein